MRLASMKNQRLKQMTFSLCIVLSLFASSIAACVCRDSAMTENHCVPPHSHESKAENHSHEADDSHHEAAQETPHETVSTSNFSVDVSFEECCCASSAPRVFAKSETVKIEKQTADYQPNAPPEIKVFVSAENVETIDFAKPFYLSDSFYNLKSPRAPPRL